MAYVRQARLDRNKKILFIALGLTVVLILIVFGTIATRRMVQKETKVNLSVKSEQSKVVNLVRTNTSIQAGESADITKFEIVAVPQNLVPDSAITSIQELKNKRVTSNMEKNEFLRKSDLVDSTAWYEEGDRLMEHIFQEGAIPATVNVGSVVDIKLFKQNSEDAVVVSKTVVIGKTDRTLSFYLNSMEQEFLKEANTEGVLFLVQYLDKAQPASVTSYYPSYGKGQAKESDTESFADSSMSKE